MLAIRRCVQLQLAVLKSFGPRLEAKLLALRFHSSQFAALYFGSRNAAGKKQDKRQVAHVHPLSARTLAQEA